jgi:hypothetical protein
MGIPANQKTERKVRAKIRDKKKNVHPASRKPEKATWAKKGIPVD